MNALLTTLALILVAAVVVLQGAQGAAALLVCIICAAAVGYTLNRAEHEKQFLLQIFVAGLLVRVLIGTLIFTSHAQEYFGGDAISYDESGYALLRVWQGAPVFRTDVEASAAGWGMPYLVAFIYALIGRNMLAVQFFNAVVGAATAPMIFLCARHIFRNNRVARLSTFLVAFYPSLVLWSSQGLKDGPIVFLLALAMLATLKLGEKLSVKYFLVLVGAALGILALRFYVFYMLMAAIGGALVIGMRPLTSQRLWRQFIILIGIGLSMTYLGVLRTASHQLDTFGNLEAVQRSRSDLAQSAESGYGRDMNVSTTAGALKAIPLGMAYLLFAPFPWQYSVTSVRQNLTLPEMIVWWTSFPLMVLGLWFTLRYRLRQSLPILLFTSMLTVAYSVFQGNVGTAYRQRAQLLIFYFIFVAVGIILLKERGEEEQQRARAARQALIASRPS